MAQARALPGTVGATTFLPERRGQVEAAHEPRRSEPEDGSGGDGDGDGKRQHTPADGYVIEARQAFRNKLQQEFPGAEENRETSDAAKHEEQQALGEELTNEAHSCGSQCLANRHLASSRAGASKQQIGDVGAADQQDEAHRSEQQNERLANVADKSLGQGSEVESPRALRRIIRRILLLQRCNQGIETPLRGLRRETRLKARDGLEGQTRAAHRRRVVRKSPRRPQFGTALLAGLTLVAKAGGHDADNMSGIVVKAQSLAENVRVGAKCALPEPIADYDFAVEAECGVVRIEGAAQLRVDAEHREVARCDRL